MPSTVRHELAGSTGPNPTYKFGDQWVVSDRLLARRASGRTSATTSSSTSTIAGARRPCSRRSSSRPAPERPLGAQSVNIRPANSVNVNTNYFLPGELGGDHAFKFGGYWRDATAPTRRTPAATRPAASRRDRLARRNDRLRARGRRLPDRRHPRRPEHLRPDEHLGATCRTRIRTGRADRAARPPLRPQPRSGARGQRRSRTRCLPTLLPAVTFAGVDPGVMFNNFSPRVGLTYDLDGQRQDDRCARTTRRTSARSATAACRRSSTRCRASASATRGSTLNHDEVRAGQRMYDSRACS